MKLYLILLNSFLLITMSCCSQTGKNLQGDWCRVNPTDKEVEYFETYIGEKYITYYYVESGTYVEHLYLSSDKMNKIYLIEERSDELVAIKFSLEENDSNLTFHLASKDGSVKYDSYYKKLKGKNLMSDYFDDKITQKEYQEAAFNRYLKLKKGVENK